MRYDSKNKKEIDRQRERESETKLTASVQNVVKLHNELKQCIFYFNKTKQCAQFRYRYLRPGKGQTVMVQGMKTVCKKTAFVGWLFWVFFPVWRSALTVRHKTETELTAGVESHAHILLDKPNWQQLSCWCCCFFVCFCIVRCFDKEDSFENLRSVLFCPHKKRSV